MDIRKLQRAIVDGLEDVKAQNIRVFNTEHLSPLFERVIVASGTSNRQTKALAASVRDAVKAAGFAVLRTEGEDNGEWIIVDCGAAVAHIMQPTIREYYHLEEIWGDKPVALKTAAAKGLPKASGDGEKAAPAKKAASAKRAAVPGKTKAAAPTKAASAKKAAAPAKKAAAPAKKAAPARKATPARAASTKAAPTKAAPPKAAAPARKAAAAKKPVARKS
ncbi:MAG: ribosome silencing factor [Burkholderiales bacterium]|nr:ribosome silencing factor [Burkholderiales bacterium]